MENNVTFLPLKLISQKAKKFRNLTIVLIGIGISSWILIYAIGNSCGIQQVSIMSDINHYQQTLDPEFCESMVERILDYNEECDSYIEIFDCG